MGRDQLQGGLRRVGGDEYEPLFSGRSLFWRHFAVQFARLIGFRKSALKTPSKWRIMGWDRRREAWAPENSATHPHHGFGLSPLALPPNSEKCPPRSVL